MKHKRIDPRLKAVVLSVTVPPWVIDAIEIGVNWRRAQNIAKGNTAGYFRSTFVLDALTAELKKLPGVHDMIADYMLLEDADIAQRKQAKATRPLSKKHKAILAKSPARPARIPRAKQCANWLATYLKEAKQPVAIPAVLSAAAVWGYNRAMVYRARAYLNDVLVVTGSGKSVYWGWNTSVP